MAIIHMICGPVSAGKSTYAIQLAKELGAVRFSIDDWISNLFFADKPEPLTYEWAVARGRRCEEQILEVSQSMLALGTDVIWDMGFMERDQRDRILGEVSDRPHSIRLHVLDAPANVRRKRVQQRNVEKPEGYNIDVTDEIFDFMEQRSVAVSAEEAEDIIHTDTSSNGKS